MLPSKDMRAILNCFREPAILLSLEYEILLASDSYRARYGFSDRQKKRHCYEVSHHYTVPCDMAGESCPLKQSRETKENTQVLHIHHTPQGQEYVNVEMLPVVDPDTNEVLYFIELMRPSEAATAGSSQDRLVGRSPAFQAMLNLVERVAASETNVMLLGASGTGKEMVAQTVHRLSNRCNAPFVPVECTGLPEGLFESELFGYVRGAFTGANADKPGLVESADGGTLFLDEVGDIPLSVQVKLLRLLESRRYRRVGSTESRESNFRLVCATNKDLHRMVKEGTFRDDLFYRLNVFEIELPRLHDRLGDLEPLIETILQRLSVSGVEFSDDALACLRQYDFPGNVRELRNIVERAVLLADDGIVHPKHLPRQCQMMDETQRPDDGVVTLEKMERRYLQRVLGAHQGDRKELARKLGVSERVLYRKLATLRDG